ncbi:MAG: helix-turn-helix domain-containing protein [Planctomycetes bacterium]|nr:helix-turn-helix domain-containing protein [Planctomycetota bacterium]
MTAVPALKRGLCVLDVLNRHEDLSLEQIACITEFPKASILRMLETMAEMGLVQKKTNNKHYAALAQVTKHKQEFPQLLMHALQDLANSNDVCVEWYEVTAEGLRIAQRFSAPENEILVFARQGYLRPWQGELEAVIAIAQSFTEEANVYDVQHAWNYDDDGEEVSLSAQQCNDIFKKATQEKYYCDQRFNSNGVRRMAVPVMADGECKGVIALALSFTPQLKKILSSKRAALIACAERIQQETAMEK